MNRTKDVIFKAAVKVFSQKGYSKATMELIASSAGVAKGTLYYNFKSKEEIFKYIIERGMENIRNEVDESLRMVEDPVEKLRIISKVQLNLVHNNRDFFKAVMSQLWGQEFRQLQLRETMAKYIRYIEIFIKEAMEEGYIQKGETLFMAYTFFGNLCSAIIYELIHNECNDVKHVQENLMTYIFEGIGIK